MPDSKSPKLGVGGASGSPLRELMSEAQGAEYQRYANLMDAKADPKAVVVMEGDDGGQIYVVAPVPLVACDEATLRSLLFEVDELQWAAPDMAHLSFERRPNNGQIAGGMGGGRANEDIWIHPRLERVHARIRDVILGRARGLSVA